MASFLNKITRLSIGKSRPVPAARAQWVDEKDPRIIYYLRPRARRISIKMDSAKREIAVTVPGSSSKLQAAKKFVSEKYDWVLVQLENLPPAQPFIDGRSILFRGENYSLVCPAPRGRAAIDYDAKQIIVPASIDTFEGRAKRFLIREARTALTNCTHVHANAVGKSVDKISVRDTSSRWGSCLKGNARRGGQISYSWRLICAPPFVLDYVAAHECAHLIEANHGPDFWALCSRLVETTAPAKRWLNQNGDRLHAVGARQ